MAKAVFHRGSKSAGTGFLCEGCSTLFIFLCYEVCVISNRVCDPAGDEILDIAKSKTLFERGCFFSLSQWDSYICK